MKKLLGILFAFMLCVSLAACGETPSLPEPPAAARWGRVFGTVTENGAPVEGVSVTAGTHTAVTDGNGAYAIEVYDDGATLVFEKEGYFTQKKTLKSSSFYTDEIEYSFLMFRKTRVSGTVTRGGVPVAGAKVAIGLQETETDADGNFVFEEVIATSMILTAEQDGKRARKALYTEEMRTGSVSVELELE